MGASPARKPRKRSTLARETGNGTVLTDSKQVTARMMTPAEVTANPKVVAQNNLRPVVQAAYTIGTWVKDLDIPALAEELYDQSLAVINGTMKRPEAMLVSQAHTLDIIFNTLSRRAVANFNEGHGVVGEAILRMSLRAQSQCRATLEALALLKNPPAVAFVRQANVAHGPQQVNNTPQLAETSRAGESENRPNKLLEQQQRNEWMDARTAAAPRRSDPSVEAVGAVNRTKDGRG